MPAMNLVGQVLGAVLVSALTAAPLAAETVRIEVSRLKFSPQAATAHVGDTVEWVSSDFVAHTATARDKQWDVLIPAKGVGRFTPTAPGNVEYFCRFHPNMTGKLNIVP
jgi:plastocyanin